MMHRSFGKVLSIIVFVFSSMIFADETFRFDEGRVPYQLRESSQRLESIHEQLKLHNTSLSGIERIITELNDIMNIAKNCQQEIKKGLGQIDVLSKQIEKMDNREGFDKVYRNFDYDKSVKKSTLVYCQLLSYNSEKYLYEANQQRHLKPQTFIHDVPLMDILRTPHLFSYPIRINDLSDGFGFSSLSVNQIMDMKVLTVVGVLIGLLISIKLRTSYHKNKSSKFGQVLKDSIYFLPIFFPLLFNSIFLVSNTYELLNPPMIRLLLLILLFMVVLVFSLIQVSLYFANEKNKQWINQLIRLMLAVFFINIFNVVFEIFLTVFLESNPLVDFLFKSYLMIANVVNCTFMYWFLFMVSEPHMFSKKYHKWMTNIHSSVIYVAIFFHFYRLTFIIIGHDIMAVMITLKVAFFMIFVGLVFIFHHVLYRIHYFFEFGKSKYAQRVRVFLSKGDIYLQQKEFMYLRFLLMVYILVVLLPYFLTLNAFSSNYLLKYEHLIYDGIGVVNFTIVPIRLLNGLILFLLMMIASKWLGKYSSITLFAKYDIDRRHTLSMIIKYFSLLLAGLLFIMVLGISLEHLSMIIGFFSFGVGIGMQSILIDLISGLVVLMHKPIRINDYVTLSIENFSVTGHIQKILLLSTQIITDDQSVIHVRNSNILRGNLENHSLFNQISKCFIPFSLSNVNDFEKAKVLILNVVKNKPEINQTGAYEPVVILDSTNARDYVSSVVINVSFHINQIEKKQYVIDDVMKKIILAFKTEGISFVVLHHNS